MVDAAPLRALRYDPMVAGRLSLTSAPAYDVIDPINYTQRRTANPYTVLELMAPAGAYRRSRQLFDRWRRSGVLVAHEPAFFRYEEHELGAGADGLLHVQRGLLAAVRLEPLEGGEIVPHEQVDPDRVAARLRRLEAVPAELDPVYLVLEEPPADLSRFLTAEPRTPPVVAISDEQGTDHRIWAVEDPAEQDDLRRLLAGTRALIADGHHRYARSLAFRDTRQAAASRVDIDPDGRATATEPSWERFFAYLVDPCAGGPRLEALHRLLSPINAEQLDRLLSDFTVQEAPSDPDLLSAALARSPGRTYGLLRSSGPALLLRPVQEAALHARLPEPWRDADPASVPDIVVLTHALLEPLELPSTAVSPVADLRGAANQVSSRSDAALMLLRPPTLRTVFDLAARGMRLPVKSTRFVPKPRTGLLLRALEDLWGP